VRAEEVKGVGGLGGAHSGGGEDTSACSRMLCESKLWCLVDDDRAT
jgi:hypothetical protein